MKNIISSKNFGYYPTHPGGILKDELKCRKIKDIDFSKQIEIDYSVLKNILNKKSPITAEIAILIETVLNIDATIWINLQSRYDLQIATKSKRLINKVEKIRKKVKERELSNN
ncbi:MAG: HigA family addiction module antidote protein [Bacteroidales bacterium]|jgi:addiction module HigA family antidote|nr:HigA family addiction module antidote protein [Bacteroidales bacterium]